MEWPLSPISEWHGLSSDSTNHILICDLENRDSLREVDAGINRIVEIALSANGDYLASSRENELLIRGLGDCKNENDRVVKPHDANIEKILCSPKGVGFVYCSQNVIYHGVLDSKEEAPRVLFEAEVRILMISFIQNDSLIAVSKDGVLLTWNDSVGFDLLGKRKLNFEIPDPVAFSSSETPNRVIFSFSGSYCACMVVDKQVEKDIIQVCDTSLTLMDLINGHLSTIWGYCFNFTEDELATSSEDNSIKIWKCDKNRWLLRATARNLFFFKGCEIDETNKRLFLATEAGLNQPDKKNSFGGI